LQARAFDVNVPEEVAIIISSDVVGYTRMMGEDHESGLCRLRAARDDAIESSVATHGGRVVKRLGDGWLAAFEDPLAAIGCAREIQDRLGAVDLLRVRIGVRVGRASFVDEDVFGAGVNVASRLESLASPRGIAISSAAISALDAAARAGFEDAGRRALKNVADPVDVLTAGGLSPEAPDASAVAAPSIVIERLEARGGEDVEEIAEDLRRGVEIELARCRWLQVAKGAKGGVRPKDVAGGALRTAGRRARITAGLAVAADGRRLWSERVDLAFEDAFALQDQVCSRLASRISAEIDAHENILAAMRHVEQLNATELSVRPNDPMSTGCPTPSSKRT